MSDPLPYSAIYKKNLSNIMAKLQAGKTLTSAENKVIENSKRESEGMRPDKIDDDLAVEFLCTRKSIERAKRAGCPFDRNDAEIYEWTKKHQNLLKWSKSYEKQHGIKSKIYRTGAEIKTAEQLRDEYLAELNSAKDDGNDDREKVALNAYLKIDKQIREAEAHAKKLGIDKGEVLSRGEVERILRAMFWAGNALCGKYAKQIAQRLSGKEPADIYKILAPTLTALTLFEGMKRLSKCPGDVNLPEWVVECAKTERQQYLKD